MYYHRRSIEENYGGTMRVELFADWHTHTTFSDGHATPEEMVLAAARRGLEEVAITEHGPRGMFIGVRDAGVYLKLKKEVARLNKKYPVRVLLGAEANVTGLNGGLDIPREIIKKLDIVIAGLHPQVWCVPWWETCTWILPNLVGRAIPRVRDWMRQANTTALVEAIQRNPLTFISHPDLMMAVDLDAVARACSQTGCAMEINVGHRYYRDDVVLAALRRGVQMVVNSDAHFSETVGNLAEGVALLEKYNVPPEQVLNARKH